MRKSLTNATSLCISPLLTGQSSTGRLSVAAALMRVKPLRALLELSETDAWLGSVIGATLARLGLA